MWDDQDFADVTLACADRKQFQAYNFVLSSSRPFFKEILRSNKHHHPLIYGCKDDISQYDPSLISKSQKSAYFLKKLKLYFAYPHPYQPL